MPHHSEALIGSTPGAPTLVVQPHADSPVAAVQVWFDVGSADEAEGEHGACHFLEHLSFRGSLAAAVEQLGGEANAFTGPDRTVFHATCPSASLPDVAELLAQAVTGLEVPEAGLEAEKQVICQEIRGREAGVGQALQRAVFEAALPVHPYRRPVTGTEEEVQGLSRETLLTFQRRWFHPERTCIVATADIDGPAMLELLGKTFPAERFPAQGPAPVRKRLAGLGQDGPRSVLHHSPYPATFFDLAFRGCALSSPAAALLDLLALCLGQGEGSQLNRKLRGEVQQVDGISASSWAPHEPGFLVIEGLTSAGQGLEALGSTLEVLQEAQQTPPTGSELGRARACIEAEHYRGLQTADGRARSLGYWASSTGGLAAEQAYFQAIAAASPGDLLDVARAFLRPERLTAGLLVPEGSPVQLEDIAELIRRGLPASPAPSTPRPPAPTTPRLPGQTGETGAPRSRPAAPPRGGNRLWRDLPTGARLCVEAHRGSGLVALRARIPGGRLLETPGTAGWTRLLARCWQRADALPGFPALDLATEELGGELRAESGYDSLSLSASFLGRCLEPGLRLCEALLCDASFSQALVRLQRSSMLSSVERRSRHPEELAWAHLAPLLFGAHPWGLPGGGSRQSLQGADGPRLAELLGSCLQQQGLVLAVVGDVEPSEVADRLEAALLTLPRGTPREFAAAAPSFPTESVVEHVQRDGPQAQVLLGFAGLTADDPDRPALAVLRQLLGGSGGRLLRVLRQRLGLVYGLRTYGFEAEQPGWLGVGFATSASRVEEARTSLRQELGSIAEEGVPSEELEAAQQRLRGAWVLGRQTHAARAAAICSWQPGRAPLDGEDEWLERTSSIDPSELVRVARRIITPDRSVEVLVGPEAPGTHP